MQRRQILALSAATLATAALAQPAPAPFPSKPLRLVVGFPAGGAADVLTRVMATALAKQLGQQVIVDNRPGADGIIAANEVLHAPADGHTLLMGTNTTMVAVPSLRPNPPFDPFRDFTPLSSAGNFSVFLLVPATLPVNSVKELLELLDANPGKYNSASSNSAAELAMIQLVGKRKVVNARYKGDVPALTDLVGGRIHMIFTTGTTAPAFVKDGRAKALMVLQSERSQLLPNVPTGKELGLGNLTILPWAGFFGPSGLPPAVRDRLSTALQAALETPEVKLQLAQQGFDGYGMSSPQFAAFFRKQYDGFNQVVKENNVKFE
ncbi:Bug family tripartite tricarboxylate transporter substrate binding protein [Caenimonas terrae]|uniref:Bug family tripartite tricarboxylate transporter substrate binding protein n=1 Tax=Caenimonas terrae TaxID=696074 RepID=A0ABW0NCC4_9BURK